MDDNINPSPIPSGPPEKKDIKSILAQIAEPISKARTVEAAQKIILDFINLYKIPKGGEEYKALADIARHTTLLALIKHFYNSLLVYEKMKVRESK